VNERRRWFWLWAGAALVAGLALRLWFVVHMTRVVGDSLVYGDIAKTWLQHGIYGMSSDDPGGARRTLIRLPGYPMFLAACFKLFGMENYNAVLHVQVAIDLVTCWLASALAGRLFGARAQLAVLWIAALCPFTANYTSTALTETLVLATIALAFYGFARWQDAGLGYNRWLWMVAAALSYSILLRPEQGLLSASVLPAMLWRTLTKARSRGLIRRALPVVVAALCTALPFVPWTARNAHYFHVFQPLAPRSANDPGEPILSGYGHWYRAWAIDFDATFEFCWPMDGEPIDFAKLPERAFDAKTPAEAAELRKRTAALIADYNDGLALTPEIDARFDRLAAVLIQAHPVRYHVGLPMARVLDMALRPRTETIPISLEWWQWSRHRGQTAFATAYAALNLAFFVAAFAGFAVWRRRGWLSPEQRAYGQLAAAMAASIVLRSMLLLFIDNSEQRFTLEFFPVFLVWIGALFAARRPGQSEAAARPGGARMGRPHL
jgi:4-amino-4-deoxy-L-arabinose transferase-like glycosyltransferase